jgi:hypothetical protein
MHRAFYGHVAGIGISLWDFGSSFLRVADDPDGVLLRIEQ